MAAHLTLEKFQREQIISVKEIDNINFCVQTTLPMPLFKAIQSRWADSFFDTGELRLGTVWDFRRSEFGDKIGDGIEGIRAYRFDIDGVPIVAGAVAKDSFVFCASHDFDAARFGDDQYDAAYIIEDVRFFIEIAKVLSATHHLKGCGLQQVFYADESEIIEYAKKEFSMQAYIDGTLTDIMPPVALVKPPRFANQNEVRAIFEPLESANVSLYHQFDGCVAASQFMEQRTIISRLVPVNIVVPNARQFAKRIA